MVWIEEIRLRAAMNKKEKALHYLINTARSMKNVKDLTKANVLVHAFLKNDFSFQLVWDTDSPADQGSEEAMNLRAMLKQFGLVNYNLWIEEK
jgi:hypothetical protein